MTATADNFDQADSDDLGGEWCESVAGTWTYVRSKHTQIRETCETIQAMVLTIAIPVFVVLGALLLAGLVRAIWTV